MNDDVKDDDVMEEVSPSTSDPAGRSSETGPDTYNGPTTRWLWPRGWHVDVSSEWGCLRSDLWGMGPVNGYWFFTGFGDNDRQLFRAELHRLRPQRSDTTTTRVSDVWKPTYGRSDPETNSRHGYQEVCTLRGSRQWVEVTEKIEKNSSCGETTPDFDKRPHTPEVEVLSNPGVGRLVGQCDVGREYRLTADRFPVTTPL